MANLLSSATGLLEAIPKDGWVIPFVIVVLYMSAYFQGRRAVWRLRGDPAAVKVIVVHEDREIRMPAVPLDEN